MCERQNDKGAGALYELNAIKGCGEVEQETRWCSSVSGASLERIGRER